MNLTLYSFALIMGAMCLSTAIILLACRRGDEDVYVVRARIFLALSLVGEAVCDIGGCMLMVDGTPLSLLDQYVVPTSYFVQVFLIAAYLLSLLRARYTVQRLMKFMVALLVVMTVANIVGYCSVMAAPFTFGRYQQYSNSDVGNIIRYILFSVCITSLFTGTSKVLPHANSRARHVLRAQRGMASARCFHVMIYVFFVAFLVGLADLTLLNTRYIMLFILMFCSQVSAVMTLSMLPSVRTVTAQSPVPTARPSTPAPSRTRPQVRARRAASAQRADGFSPQVEKAIENWCRRDDKPFMRTSFTLKDTARDMGVGARLLSDFLNTVYGCNFNRWINLLRIDEVKRLMETQPHLTMADLSQKAGFTDASAMAKIFKRIVGETPSLYKGRVTETGGDAPVEKEEKEE